ncbi:MAG: C2 family cysteine protease [Gemmatales bacterium]
MSTSLQAQTKPPSFFTVTNAQFDKWDANHDGVLSKTEIDGLVVDQSIRGKEAAALASIQMMQNNKKIELPPITKSYLQSQVALDGKSGQPDFQRRYINAYNKIQKSGRALFSGAINLEDMHQGRLGDCYLIAPLGSLVHRDPNVIKKMFVEQSAAGYSVRFADGHTVKVPALTDAEVALTGTTEGHGLWLAVMEKAISLTKTQETGNTNDPDSVAGNIGRGGSTMRFIPLLTGHQGKSMGFHEKDSPLKASEAKVRVKLQDVRQILVKEMADHRLVCCSTTTDVGVPGLSSRHAYAVLSFDASRDVVTIWNPHGNKYVPKGPAGLTNGFPTTDGKFTMTLAEFVKAFRSMSYEGPEAASYSGVRKKKG